MDKKKILIIVGIVAVGGIGFYLWNKSKKTAEGGAEAPADATTKTADAPADATKSAETPAPSKAPLNTRKEKKKACGRKPLNKNKKAEWQKCVDAGGTASFEGDFDQWENDYMDFSGLNLDL
jgi:hypothetical protein